MHLIRSYIFYIVIKTQNRAQNAKNSEFPIIKFDYSKSFISEMFP
jgi:hypothetical protein